MIESYSDKILRLTGRKIIYTKVECEMCEQGSSQFESVCSNCAGSGQVNEWVFADCHCPVESDCEHEREAA